MSEKWASFLISGDSVTVVEAIIPDDDDDPIEITLDVTWKVQKGNRSEAYEVLYERCRNYLTDGGIDNAVIKASAVAKGLGLSMLHSAEVRGVIIAASAAAQTVSIVQKATVTKTYGNRKVDEYLTDNAFWAEQTSGMALRKTSREGAMYIVALRAK